MTERLQQYYNTKRILQTQVECLQLLLQLCDPKTDKGKLAREIRNKIEEVEELIPQTFIPSTHCARVPQFSCWCRNEACPKYPPP